MQHAIDTLLPKPQESASAGAVHAKARHYGMVFGYVHGLAMQEAASSDLVKAAGRQMPDQYVHRQEARMALCAGMRM